MDNVLQTALAEAVNGLASFFGTTTEAVMEHAPELLAKYGWYYTLNGLGDCALSSFFIVVFIGFVVVGFAMFCDMDVERPGLKLIGLFVAVFVFIAGIKVITCAAAPEIVGAHAILNLLKSVK